MLSHLLEISMSGYCHNTNLAVCTHAMSYQKILWKYLVHHWKYIRSDAVCPYGIVTCPRHDRKKGVLELFINCGHQDSTDCTNEAQGSHVFAYLQEVLNSTTVLEYFSRMYSTFCDVLVRPIISLPTTCAWRLIEDLDQFGFNHILYFVVVEAGIA